MGEGKEVEKAIKTLSDKGVTVDAVADAAKAKESVKVTGRLVVIGKDALTVANDVEKDVFDYLDAPVLALEKATADEIVDTCALKLVKF